MKAIPSLDTVRYYHRQLLALRGLLDRVVETINVWDQMHPAERHSRLVCVSGAQTVGLPWLAM